MEFSKRLTLAVAGSRKTQGIVEQCRNLPKEDRILVLTYTQSNQDELRSRLRSAIGETENVTVMGWFAFLISHIVKPYLPFVFPGKRVRGFDFDSPPQQKIANTDSRRYFTERNFLRKVHLPQLAFRIEEAGANQGMWRTAALYDHVFVDEVQDLCGYDLEILSLMLEGHFNLEMVGDIRQAILATNVQEKKNAKYKFMGIWQWFQEQEKAGRLAIDQRRQTHRCRPEIAALADSLFDSQWGFEVTESLNEVEVGHDGVFVVYDSDLEQYISKYNPLFLRDSKRSGRNMSYTFMNIGVSKGLSFKHVLILPTEAVRDFLLGKSPLQHQQAANLYVAITRAEQSVAFVMKDGADCFVPKWQPGSAK